MLSDLRYRLRALFARADMDHELNEELRFHIEHETEKLMATGLSRDEAARRARLAFGGIDRIAEDTRDARGINFIDTAQQDLRYAWRGLRARPGFASAIVVALALGIGANAAMFGIVDHLMFRPPLYIVNVDRVHRVYVSSTDNKTERTERSFEYPRYVDLTKWTTAFDKTAVVAYRKVPVGTGDETREMTIAAVSATLFDLFDARPVLGRFFSADEDQAPAGATVAVLSYGFWQSHYGGRRDIVGTRLNVADHILTIIGVAPEGFSGITDDAPPVAFLPVTTVAAAQVPTFYQDYGWSWLEMFARRRPDISVARADADLTAAYRRSWQNEHGDGNPRFSLDIAHPHAMTGSIHLSRGPEAGPDSKVAGWVMGVALIVLLIACANVANLLLARAVSRHREIALRVALGVSRRRLVQQLATESVILAALGGVAGLVVAQTGARFLRAMFIADESAGGAVTDARTLGFVAAITVLVALVTGLAPAFHSLRTDVNGALKAGSREGSYRRSRLGTALLLFQGALSVVLLVGAGLFVRSLNNVRAMRLGYDIEPVLYIEANIGQVQMTRAEAYALHQRMLEVVETTPGVTSATLTISVPFWSSEGRGVPYVPGKDSLRRLGRFILQAGSTSYFTTVGTRILHGRGFEPSDLATSPRVAVISQAMANGVWPGEDAIGKQFRIGNDTMPFLTVVGIAENVRGLRLTGKDELWYYVPIAQYAASWSTYPTMFARMSGRPEAAVDLVRRRLQPLIHGSAYVNVTPLKAMVGTQQKSWEFGATMFVAFGALALLLAAIGLYSVIAYAVAQRTRELGVRIALGASAGNVIRMIVGQGVAFAMAGIVIGSLIALAASRWVEPLLFAQSARDPAVFLAVGSVLLIVAIIASARPAIRAMRVDPSQVLRTD